jgi:dTDP-4-dehydrorhamnose reductase
LKNIKTILITGANGQLGSEIRFLSGSYPQYVFLFTDFQELSIDDRGAIENYFVSNKIDCCINCAAYTAVDKAEADIEVANKINGYAVGYLAEACKKNDALFIHISTDYVFDGTATQPYKVDHPVNPVNIYGSSKLLGEQLAFEKNPSSIVIRTSWVYSSVGNNFVKTMLRLMTERDSLNVVSDQVGCPTYAADLASAILQVVVSGKATENAGFYHYSNQGVISWYDFAVAIKEISKSSCVVGPIKTEQYPTTAKRPAYSVMDTSKIREIFNIDIPQWRDSLQKCMSILLKA